jgi:hypothetical protein
MINIFTPASTGLTHKQCDFLHLDMFGLTDEELATIMKPEEIQEMKDFFVSLDKKKNATDNLES